MKQIKNIFLAILAVVGMTSCQDDLLPDFNGVDVNRPVSVNLSLALPRSPEIVVTRADNSQSDISNGVRLYIFNGEKFLSTYDIPQTDLTNTSTDNSGRHYTAENVALYVGTQMVYAVANVSGTGYFDDPTNLLSTLENAARKGRTTFLQTFYTSYCSNSNAYPQFASESIPLSGMGEITVDAKGQTDDVIKLKRLVAQVKFEITTEYNSENKTVTFTPQNFAFYNLPKQAYMFGGQDQSILAEEDNFYNSAPATVGTSSGGKITFDEYVPENIQVKKENSTIASYDDREKFEGTGNEKNWIAAPDQGMYVVITGQCSVMEDGALLQSGQVKYTIHLGDFSTNDKLDNFSIERNNIYTYRVSVQGMDNIKVEATTEQLDGGSQPGAEGDVIELDAASEMFNLDSHYEQVYVEYSLNDIADNIEMGEGTTEEDLKNRIANNFILSIHTPLNTKAISDELITPYNANVTEEVGMKGIDYKWIEFYPQEGKTISPYPGRSNEKLLSPWQVCQKLGEAVYQIKKGEKPDVDGLTLHVDGNRYYARFTIFVDEYFYQKDLSGKVVAWETYTNAEPRTMLIASDMHISKDLNSTYSTALTYIRQVSIETFYNPDASGYYNAMGIETYNEDGAITGFGTPHSVFTGFTNEDESKGRANTLVNICGTEEIDNQNVGWEKFIQWNKIGYLKGNMNKENGNRPGYNTSQSAYYACLSRNRDLNGNGKIEDNEVRWYLPAVSQYLRMGIGANALSEDARPYTGDKQSITSADYDAKPMMADKLINEGALYYMSNVSQGATSGFYWAVEVGSYGSPSASEKAQIRCVRNLPSKNVVPIGDEDAPVGREAWAGPVYDELKHLSSGNGIFVFGDRLIASLFRDQSEPMEGSYRVHTELDDENNLPEAFVVSKNYVDGTHSINNPCDPSTDPCRNYSEDNSNGRKGMWRTPNLSELMVMAMEADDLDLLPYNSGNASSLTLCSTKFSNQSVRQHFYFNGRFITTSTEATAGRVRCVRDATSAEIAEVQ